VQNVTIDLNQRTTKQCEVMDSEEFILCEEYAVDRGWIPVYQRIPTVCSFSSVFAEICTILKLLVSIVCLVLFVESLTTKVHLVGRKKLTESFLEMVIKFMLYAFEMFLVFVKMQVYHTLPVSL